MSDAEPDFEDGLAEMEDAVENALNELTDVKAYILKNSELKDFKAAQYALRNLAPDKTSDHDVQGVYDD